MLISLLEVGEALFGFVAGMVLGVIGARRALLCSLAMLVATTVTETTASVPGMMFAARAIVGCGYLLVVASAPSMIVAATDPGSRRDRAMVLWSTFVPVGIGLGSAVTDMAARLMGTDGAISCWAAVCLMVTIVVMRIDAPAPVRRRTAVPGRGAWLLSGGFGCYTLFLCAMTGLSPTFLLDHRDTTIATGSIAASFVALSALLAIWAIRLAGSSLRHLLAMLAAVLMSAALLAPLVYRVSSLATCAAIAALVVVLAGIARTMVFTRLPALSRADRPNDPRIAAAQGHAHPVRCRWRSPRAARRRQKSLKRAAGTRSACSSACSSSCYFFCWRQRNATIENGADSHRAMRPD